MQLDNKTLKMFARLCKVAYTQNIDTLKTNANTIAKDWKLVATSQETEGAYDMAYRSFAMVNDQTKQVLVVNAGTRIKDLGSDDLSGLGNDLIAGLQITVFKTTPKSFLDDGIIFLDSLLETYKDYSFINTGHSLGAVYAQLSQAYLESNGAKSTTHVFESMGSAEVVKYFIEEQDLDVTLEKIAESTNIYNVDSSFISSKLNNQLGCIFTLPKEKVIGLAGLLGKIAGIQGADKIFEAVDSGLSSVTVHALDYIIPRLSEKTVLTPTECYDGMPQEETQVGNLVEEALKDIANLFDLA